MSISPPAQAQAQTAGGANNIVSASASAGNSVADRSGTQVASFGGPTDTSANIAAATSHDCTGCRAAAAALQAVFITHDASTITPANVASATNANCISCDSFAFAYQYVITTPGPVFLSQAAQQEIAQLRSAAAAAVASDLPDDQLEAQLETITSQFKQTIDDDLQQAKLPAQGSVTQRVSVAPPQ